MLLTYNITTKSNPLELRQILKTYLTSLTTCSVIENWNIPRVAEAATGGVLQNRVFLKISQISQENTYVGVSF